MSMYLSTPTRTSRTPRTARTDTQECQYGSNRSSRSTSSSGSDSSSSSRRSSSSSSSSGMREAQDRRDLAAHRISGTQSMLICLSVCVFFISVFFFSSLKTEPKPRRRRSPRRWRSKPDQKPNRIQTETEAQGHWRPKSKPNCFFSYKGGAGASILSKTVKLILSSEWQNVVLLRFMD